MTTGTFQSLKEKERKKEKKEKPLEDSHLPVIMPVTDRIKISSKVT